VAAEAASAAAADKSKEKDDAAHYFCIDAVDKITQRHTLVYGLEATVMAMLKKETATTATPGAPAGAAAADKTAQPTPASSSTSSSSTAGGASADAATTAASAAGVAAAQPQQPLLSVVAHRNGFVCVKWCGPEEKVVVGRRVGKTFDLVVSRISKREVAMLL
jgi:hypothetical protein